MQVAPVDVVSVCDVDSKMLNEAADLIAARQKSKKRPRVYADYRQLLAEKDLDIVVVGTPDHWHALPTIEAIQAGADVYVEKPTSVDIVESEAMLKAARKYGRVVQVGTQRRSTPHLVQAKERIVDEGLLGKVSHVEVYCYYHMRARGNPPEKQPPSHLDYEMWTGPAPMRPYCDLIHPRSWRAFNEYGNGIMGDMCIHMLDTVRWILNLGWPKRVSSKGGIWVDKQSRANIPDTQTATFEFPELNVVWTHRTWGDPPDPEYPWGATLYGEKGTLKLSVEKFDFIPRGAGQKIHQRAIREEDQFPEDVHEKDIDLNVAPAIRYQMLDFMEAVQKRTRPVADIEEGHISTTACILANLSMDVGRTLIYDPEKRIVENDDQATKLLARPYRDPWVHPTPENI